MGEKDKKAKSQTQREKQQWSIDLAMFERLELRQMVFKAPAREGQDVAATRAVEALGTDDELDLSRDAPEDRSDAEAMAEFNKELARKLASVAALPMTIGNIETLLEIYAAVLKKEVVNNDFSYRMRNALRRFRAAAKGEEIEGARALPVVSPVAVVPPADSADEDGDEVSAN